ncbi:MAG: GatB/YqeY domain-containing protein [Acidobacteriota bacterium]|nr:GatB/YqeY domain-containing protein [Acidobacteriota bacterium]
MPLADRLQKDLVAAMKARDEARLSAVRMIKTAVQKAAVADPSKPLTEAAEQQLLKSLVKQRVEAAEMFRKGGREELAAKEDSERSIIEGYLPVSATDEEIEAAVTAALVETGAASAKQMGLVIKAAQAKLAGTTVDGKILSEKVKSKLSSSLARDIMKLQITLPFEALHYLGTHEHRDCRCYSEKDNRR